jgi:hypothetical protein
MGVRFYLSKSTAGVSTLKIDIARRKRSTGGICGEIAPGVAREEGRMFFFEKKNQKTFTTLARSLAQPPGSDSAPH